MTSPPEDPRLADVVELPFVRAADRDDPQAPDDQRETETIILLW